MTNEQLYFAVGVPLVVNTTMVLLVYWALDNRIADLRETLRAELRRVEEVLDARLKHLEEK
jgi:uncharacterized protein involved in cysteine biosynthesis